MNRITAAEARALSGPSVEDHVEEAYLSIRAAASRGHHEVKLHGWWATEGYKESGDYAEARKILINDGYSVFFHYEERQFVDMYTVVKW